MPMKRSPGTCSRQLTQRGAFASLGRLEVVSLKQAAAPRAASKNVDLAAGLIHNERDYPRLID
eukprot:5147487-Prorocentrum_lima.AAC.1